jgi:hypothetical protein
MGSGLAVGDCRFAPMVYDKVNGQSLAKISPRLPVERGAHGYLLSAVLMVPIGYAIFQIFPLLGYDDPKEAPFALGTAVLFVLILIFQIMSHYASGGTYEELQRRRLEKRKRRK